MKTKGAIGGELVLVVKPLNRKAGQVIPEAESRECC